MNRSAFVRPLRHLLVVGAACVACGQASRSSNGANAQDAAAADAQTESTGPLDASSRADGGGGLGSADASLPVEASSADVGSPDTAPTESADAGASRQLDIPPRVQWNNADGYCGETSIQSIGLYYGAWVSEEVVRNVAGGELLVGVNDTTALGALDFTYAEWDSTQATPQFEPFMVWLKDAIVKGTPPIFTVYLTDGDDDPDYDHIMPATGIVAASLTAYGASDELTYDDMFGDALMRQASTLSGTRASCSYSSTQGGCIPQDVDYGVIVTGIVDPDGATLPVSLSVAAPDEPNVSTGSSSSSMTATATVSGLTAGASYALLRYDAVASVPTQGAPAAYLSSTYSFRQDFTATSATYTYADPNTFQSSGTVFYRCVPK